MFKLDLELIVIAIFTVLFAVAGIIIVTFGLVSSMPYVLMAFVVLFIVGYIVTEILMNNR